MSLLRGNHGIHVYTSSYFLPGALPADKQPEYWGSFLVNIYIANWWWAETRGGVINSVPGVPFTSGPLSSIFAKQASLLRNEKWREAALSSRPEGGR